MGFWFWFYLFIYFCFIMAFTIQTMVQKNIDSMTNNLALLPRIITDYRRLCNGTGGAGNERRKSEFFGQMFHLFRPLSPSLSSVCDLGLIAGSCAAFQHVSKPISFRPCSDDEYHLWLQSALFLALKWESKTWSWLKTLLKKQWVKKRSSMSQLQKKKSGNL